MINLTTTNANRLKAPVRTLSAQIEVFNADNDYTFKSSDKLKEFTIERMGDSNKFYGYGVAQKLNFKIRNEDNDINLDTSYYCYCSMGCSSLTGRANTLFTPAFKITEVHKDENTNELSITAYDMLYFMGQRKVEELNLTAPYTLADIANEIANLYLDETAMELYIDSDIEERFNLEYPEGANLDGSETIREVLDAIAEATQSIYSLDCNEYLWFRKLSTDNDELDIDRSLQIELKTRDNKRLAAVCHATELGDNVEARLEISGTTQYIRDNPFWEMREDVGELVEAALANVGGFTIAQFDCSWRGNYALEPGDKLLIEGIDGTIYTAYYINDTFTYNGGMSQKTNWLFENNETETATNPTSLGEVLKQTYARVDKANSEILLVASATSQLNEDINETKNTTADSIDGLNDSIAELTNKVETKITPEEVSIQIKEELANGVNKVETATGFTFNDEGLTVSKSNSQMTTTITEDGMTVYKQNTEVLVANNEGVKAKDLHAETYLIVGKNSRFEDYGSSRTGCFWIGGNEY